MSVNLLIDIGNTRLKMACFINGKMKGKVKYSHPDDRILIKKEIQRCKPDTILFSSVHKKFFPDRKMVEGINFISFNHKTKIPLLNKYKTKFSLGSDRLAAAVGAYQRFKNKPVLIVDAGTCIKLNFINAKGEYLGGSISPGIRMRYQALHNFTARLPLIHRTGPAPLLGLTTDLSIRSGVINGAIAEVGGMINGYKTKYPNLIVILTGGDSDLFDKSLKMRIFAIPNLILEGLNEILEFNVSNTNR